jgi:acetyltransferase-like isoleucine patch superfamily enzyme
MSAFGFVKHKLIVRAFRKSFAARFPRQYMAPVSLFDITKVEVGDFSYGPLDAICWNNPGEHLSIGRFVSVAGEVVFLLGGNHDSHVPSTYPFDSLVLRDREDVPATKGGIVVHDDVWIGQRAMILSGVDVGQGSIIAAGAVVTRDVEPYSIVAGNPAKVVKHRFSEHVTRDLIAWADYSLLDAETIRQYRDLLYQPVTEQNLNQLHGMFEKLRTAVKVR